MSRDDRETSIQLVVRDHRLTLRLPRESAAEVARACQEVNDAIAATGGEKMEFGRAMILAALQLAQRALKAEAQVESAEAWQEEFQRDLKSRLQALLDRD